MIRWLAGASCSRPAALVLDALRDSWLRGTLARARRLSPFYRERFLAQGIDPARIRSVADLPELGFFTRPDDLLGDPHRFLAAPRRQVRFATASSGSTGQPKIVLYTDSDWETAIDQSAWGLRVSGIGPGDTAQILFCFGKPAWMTGHLTMDAFRRAGAMVVPSGNHEDPATQLATMRTYGTTVLAGTPSYLWRLTAEAGAGADLRSVGIRQIRTSAEPLTAHVRRLLEDAWGAEVYDAYGMMEMAGVIGGECSRHDGFHTGLNLAVEVVDPEHGHPVPPGAVGELVLTTLTRTASPLIRYRTGDLGALDPEPRCPCREIPTAKLGPIVGRTDDMVILGSGENFFPRQFETALAGLPGLRGFQVVIGKEGPEDTIRVRLEVDPADRPPESLIAARLLEAMPALRNEVESARTVAPPAVEFLDPGTLQRESPAKVRRLLDRRPGRGSDQVP